MQQALESAIKKQTESAQQATQLKQQLENVKAEAQKTKDAIQSSLAQQITDL